MKQNALVPLAIPVAVRLGRSRLEPSLNCAYCFEKSCSAAIVLIGVLGALKFFDLPGFEEALSTWTLVPEMSVPFLAVLVPLIEVATAGLWFVGRRLMSSVIAVCMMMIFTGALLLQSTAGAPPDCGCFGVIAEYMRAAEQLPFAITRNSILLGMIAPYMIHTMRDRSRKVRADDAI